MIKEMLGIRRGILEDIHNDHQEADQLIAQILEAKSQIRRTELFGELKTKLTAHLLAEDKVLYRRMLKSKQKDVREFPNEGAVEHEIVLGQLDALGKDRNKDSEEWIGRFTVLKELISHHVKEEEMTGFEKAREEFDAAALDRLGHDFQVEKQAIAKSPARAQPASVK